MKPKILFILHFPPPVHGAAMVGQNIRESKIINNEFAIEYINLGISRSVDEIGKGGVVKWWRYLGILALSFWNLLIFRPAIVYLTLTAKGSGFYKDALLALLIKGFRFKVVYHLHNKGVRERQHHNIDNWLYKKVFKNAEIILLSRHLYPDIQKYVAEEQVHYCPNGIPDAFSTMPIKRQSEEKIKVTILFLSNLIASKGLFVLLDACAVLQQKNIPFECVFVGGIGDVSEEEFTSKVCELKLQNKVFYVGKKYGEEKTEVFQNTDIFIHPTHEDCFPLVLLEAMQFGLPIVSTEEGAITEIVVDGQTGFIVPKRDANALAEKIELLILNEDLRTSMGLAGRKKYEAEFTLASFEKRFINILHQIS
jgi:glycosyltransferase involved in cell wall biosynthesis